MARALRSADSGIGAAKRGFTLVEVVVALLILSVGLLALGATAGIATRMVAQGRRASRVAVLAARRVEMLRSGRCAAMRSGTERHDRFKVTWTVSIAQGTTRSIRVVVVSPTSGGLRADSFWAVIPC